MRGRHEGLRGEEGTAQGGKEQRAASKHLSSYTMRIMHLSFKYI